MHPLPSMVRMTTSALISLALSGAALAAKFSSSSIPRTTTGFKNTIPNKFIVEVAEAADIPGKRSLDTRTVSLASTTDVRMCRKLTLHHDGQTHEQLYDFMRKRDLGFKVEKEFNSPGLFMGSVVTLQVRSLPACIALDVRS